MLGLNVLPHLLPLPPLGTYAPESRRFNFRPSFLPRGEPPPLDPLGTGEGEIAGWWRGDGRLVTR